MGNTPAKPVPAAEVPRPDSVSEMKAAVAKMMAQADRMQATSEKMEDQVKSTKNAVTTVMGRVEEIAKSQTELAAEMLTLRLAVARPRMLVTGDLHDAPTIPSMRSAEVAGAAGSAPANDSPSSDAPSRVVTVSLSPLESVLAKDSIRAVQLAVPKARNENRLISLAIAALVVIGEVLHLIVR